MGIWVYPSYLSMYKYMVTPEPVMVQKG